VTRDPREGVESDGTIVTGVDAAHIAVPYDAVVGAAVDVVRAHLGDALDGLYLYGSVATGQARPPESDIDLYAILVRDADSCREAARELTTRHASVVREVGISGVLLDEVLAATLEGWAERCFVRHYCVHLAGRNLQQELPACQASPALARGFNGNVGPAIARSLAQLGSGTLDEQEQRHAIAWSARKLLMSAATLLSSRAGTWATDRDHGVRLLATAAPEMATCVERVQRWTALDGPKSDETLPPLEGVTACLAEVREWLVREYELIPTPDP
jgi:hypothetical protein